MLPVKQAFAHFPYYSKWLQMVKVGSIKIGYKWFIVGHFPLLNGYKWLIVAHLPLLNGNKWQRKSRDRTLTYPQAVRLLQIYIFIN
jgi:hypothetical protein